MVIIEYNRSVRELNLNHKAFILSSFCIKKIMKRKCKKTKKEHARRNATIKRRKRTRRQRGGATINNMDVPNELARDGTEYNVVEIEKYDEYDSLKYMFIGKARAIVMHQPCGVALRCEPLVSYRIVDGPGILTWYNPDRTIHSVYQGEFVDGKKHGRGKNTFNSHPDFEEYEGDFVDGVMHGRGKMVLKNRNVYVGDFNNDFMEGNGTMTYREDNSRYEGDWAQGRMHGQGNVHDGQGTLLYSAQFINDEPQFEDEEEEEEEAPVNHANISQNSQPPAGNIFGSRHPDFFDPSSRRQ